MEKGREWYMENIETIGLGQFFLSQPAIRVGSLLFEGWHNQALRNYYIGTWEACAQIDLDLCCSTYWILKRRK